jgi:hypothetical protein
MLGRSGIARPKHGAISTGVNLHPGGAVEVGAAWC